MSSLLLLLLLSLSMHACNARHLGVIGKENREVHLLSKVVEEADQVHKISLPPRLIPSMETAEKLQPQQILPVGSDKRNPQENWGGVKNMIEIGSEALSKEEEDSKRTTTGSKIIVLSSHEDLQQATKATKIEGWKRHSRLMLGSAPHDVEETVDSKEGDIVEDIVVMDYAQPHRKPPIHNKDP
ncbi:uncharacterized protein LOC100855013 isoform X2 [Vitis vinifera]|uniref:Root meristem growth factor 8 n=1 Tax=Vitis vinifera TaxID=29760 RepID=A0A438ESF0_VITVI|nr:uncharacterized protein LOC100855013 isoform X2 [Vitis vinifera]RVW50545.1 hypothetical protein CK203_074481 [Vitis vinifera]